MRMRCAHIHVVGTCLHACTRAPKLAYPASGRGATAPPAVIAEHLFEDTLRRAEVLSPHHLPPFPKLPDSPCAQRLVGPGVPYLGFHSLRHYYVRAIIPANQRDVVSSKHGVLQGVIEMARQRSMNSARGRGLVRISASCSAERTC